MSHSALSNYPVLLTSGMAPLETPMKFTLQDKHLHGSRLAISQALVSSRI